MLHYHHRFYVAIIRLFVLTTTSYGMRQWQLNFLAGSEDYLQAQCGVAKVKKTKGILKRYVFDFMFSRLFALRGKAFTSDLYYIICFSLH